MNYPTNLLRAFAVVCSWRIQRAKIYHFLELAKQYNSNASKKFSNMYTL